MEPGHVSQGLRRWFILHFWVDMLFAVPLFLAPALTLSVLGFAPADPLFVRLVAAALFGIGGTSLLVRSESAEVYRVLLLLKMIWSGVAILALLWSIVEDPTVPGLYLGVFLFIVFFIVWRKYAAQMRVS